MEIGRVFHPLEMAFVRVAAASEVPAGTLIEILHQGVPYALCNVAGVVRALSGVCPHHGGPLGQGALEGSMISCPWHCWQFDSATGACEFGAGLAIPVYVVRLAGDNILVDLP